MSKHSCNLDVIWFGQSLNCSQLGSWVWNRDPVFCWFCSQEWLWKYLAFSYTISKLPNIWSLAMWVLGGQRRDNCCEGVDRNRHAQFCSSSDSGSFLITGPSLQAAEAEVSPSRRQFLCHNKSHVGLHHGFRCCSSKFNLINCFCPPHNTVTHVINTLLLKLDSGVCS